jgi:hypothetical protein
MFTAHVIQSEAKDLPGLAGHVIQSEAKDLLGLAECYIRRSFVVNSSG